MKERELGFCVSIALLLLPLLVATAGATTWNLVDDFAESNPNGAWSYGRHIVTLPDTAPPEYWDGFTLMESHASNNSAISPTGLVGWIASDDASDPNILYNNTDSVISSWGIDWAPGEVTMGPYSPFSAAGTGIRWTAPANGDYAIDMTFTLNQLDLSQPVYVYHNRTLLLDNETGAPLGSSVTYNNASLTMAAGDTLDFIVAGNPKRNISLSGTVGNGVTTWDVADDFSWENNPNGEWSYGFHDIMLPTDDPDFGFQPLTNMASENGTISPTGLIGFVGDGTDPNILHNPTSSSITAWGIEWSPGEVTIGCWDPNPLSKGVGVRWTASEAGNYSIAASFILNQLDDAQSVAIYLNDTLLASGDTGGPLGSSFDFIDWGIIMEAGDTIDFVVLGENPKRNIELQAMIGDDMLVPPGDANWDGVVNEEDAAIVAANWLSTGMSWKEGDFNGDKVVDDIDATILATNWTTDSGNASVPEPNSLALLLVGMVSIGLFSRRKRSN